MADAEDVPGLVAFLRGVQLSALALVLVLLFEYGRSTAASAAVLAQFGAEDVAAGVTLLTLLGILVLALALCLPVYLGLHGAEVYVTTGEVGGRVAPGGLIPPEYAGLLLVLPGVVLTWAGYRRARHRDASSVTEHAVAGVAATVGYCFAAVLAIVPGAWLFDAAVNALLSSVGGRGTDAVSLVYPDPLRVHLLVGVVYPLAFTLLGGIAAGVVADRPWENATQSRSRHENRDR